MHGVLGGRHPGWRFANPWLDAPIHLSQVYHPGLRETGAADTHRHNCMTTWPGIGGATIPPGDRVWSFPAPGGFAPYLQRVWEAPFSPQERVGIGARAATGPYLYVWSESGRPEPVGYDEYGSPVWEPWAPLERLVGGSLTDAGGRPVAIRVIENEDLGGNYVGAGNGWLLPVRPLRSGRTYQATVILSTPDWAEPDAQRQLTHTWTFKTTRAKLTRDGYLLPRNAAGRRRCLRMQVLWQRHACLAGRPAPRP